MEETFDKLAPLLRRIFIDLVKQFGWIAATLISIAAMVLILATIFLFKVLVGYVFPATNNVLKNSASWFGKSVRILWDDPGSKAIAILTVISSGVVLLGLAKMPYTFYTLLRLMLCLTAAVGFSKALKVKLELWQWTFGVLCVLYNPIFPIHLRDKGIWIAINFLTVVLFWVGAYKIGLRAVSKADP